MKRAMASGALRPVAIGRTAKSGPPRAASSAARAGISSRQGAHQVAQKLTRRTRPLEAARVVSLPSAAVKGEVGGGNRRLVDRQLAHLALAERLDRGAVLRGEIRGGGGVCEGGERGV